MKLFFGHRILTYDNIYVRSTPDGAIFERLCRFTTLIKKVPRGENFRLTSPEIEVKKL